MSFSNWRKWTERNSLTGLEYPGVYAIVKSDEDISGKPFSWIEKTILIGMSNSRGGLRSRLNQFDSTIKGGEGHGPAKRVRRRYPDYGNLVPKLYVSVHSYPCDVTTNRPDDLRIMGEVAKHEYKCFALFVEKFERLPEFNDKERSPKD